MLSDEPHHQSLELLSAQALARRDFAAAFELADRRCRIPPLAPAHAFVLRAEASYFMGYREAAVSDLARAVEIAPDDVPANRRLLAWAEGPRRISAAHSLLPRDSSFDVLCAAIRFLRGEGRKSFAKVTVQDDMIQGWAAWTAQAPLDVTITAPGSTTSISIDPDPFHPLSNCIDRAATFDLLRPRSESPQSISLTVGGEVLFSIRAPANEKPCRLPLEARLGTQDGSVTVIVPVYADHDATAACLASLVSELRNDARHRAIVVNDASPDTRICAHLETVRSEPAVTVLTNATNQGFVGSVNRALAQVASGDVILLNSDTIVPPDFISRMAAVAAASADIGTMTPVSNNGEFMSFPTPNEVNPLGSVADITRLDEIASRVNYGSIVDVPSGIGFCLYITRACLNAVGLLSENFRRGYLEDVDYCLRARALGFRSVCIPSVYVGHAGSRSFQGQKPSLVERNLEVLDRRFPKYRAECVAFALADPLAGAREEIERAALPSSCPTPHLLVTGNGVVGAVARERARLHALQGETVLLLETRQDAGGWQLRIVHPDGAIPQSIHFGLSGPEKTGPLEAFLRDLRPTRFEIMDPLNTPACLREALLRLDIPFDVFVADAGLFWPRGDHVEPEPALGHSVFLDLGGQNTRRLEWRRTWEDMTKRADRVLVPCERAFGFASHYLPQQRMTLLATAATASSRARRHKSKSNLRLGIFAIRTSVEELRMVREIAQELKQQQPAVSVAVFGETLDDAGLMRLGNVFVSGALEPDEVDRLLDQYAPGFLLLDFGEPLFGHPVITAARRAAVPTAYFDWSMGRQKRRKRDLAIDPGLTPREVATALGNWIAKN